jgi:hypothetical protein
LLRERSVLLLAFSEYKNSCFSSEYGSAWNAGVEIAFLNRLFSTLFLISDIKIINPIVSMGSVTFVIDN